MLEDRKKVLEGNIQRLNELKAIEESKRTPNEVVDFKELPSIIKEKTWMVEEKKNDNLHPMRMPDDIYAIRIKDWNKRTETEESKIEEWRKNQLKKEEGKTEAKSAFSPDRKRKIKEPKELYEEPIAKRTRSHTKITSASPLSSDQQKQL